jgi:hypothetical protein
VQAQVDNVEGAWKEITYAIPLHPPKLGVS